ncbi:MAG: hypothetical protein ABIG68_09915, partial [Acidobacteriota bacterium]
MGLTPMSDVVPLMLITEPQPVYAGTFGGVFSTFGRTNNAIRDMNQGFGGIDRLRGFQLHLGTPPNYDMWSYYTVPITESGRTENGPDPNVLSTRTDLNEWMGDSSTRFYSVRKVRDSLPAARYFDYDTGTYKGDNIQIRGKRRDIAIEQIIEAEGERRPAAGEAPTSFRHAFILLVPGGSTASPVDIERLARIRRRWEGFYREATGGLGSASTAVEFGWSQIAPALLERGASAHWSNGRGPTTVTGFARLEPGEEPAAGIAVLASRAGEELISEAAVSATAVLLRARCYAERDGRINTGLAIASPVAESKVSFELRDLAGKLVSTATITVPSGGQTARFVGELFPGYSFPASFKGSLTMASPSPIAVTALRTILNEAGEFIITTQSVSDLDAPAPAETLYLPQVVWGGGYSTEMLLVNPGNSTLTGNLRFRAQDGRAATVGIPGAADGEISYRLEANATQILSAESESADAQSCYVVLTPAAGQSAPIAFAVFTFRQGGRIVTATGVPAATTAAQVRFFVDRTHDHDAGVAIVNPADKDAALTLRAFRLDGIAEEGPSSLSLSAGHQRALFASELIPSLPGDFRGTIEISSETALATVALRATYGNRFLLATLTVEADGHAQARRVLYFPHLADGGGFSSEFILLNLGKGASTPRLSFFTREGKPLRLASR